MDDKVSYSNSNSNSKPNVSYSNSKHSNTNLGLYFRDTPSFDLPFQKSSEIADFVGKIRSKCGTNKGVSKEGVSPKYRPN